MLAGLKRNLSILATSMVLSLPFVVQADTPKLTYDTLTDQLDTPWAMAILPGDSGILVTEKAGQVKLLKDGQLTDVAGVPEVYFASQGGLLDIKLAPDFADSGSLFLSYAAGDPKNNALAIAKATLAKSGESYSLQDVEVIFTATPGKDTPVHYGGRIAFLPDATLVATTGDGFDYREQAQFKDNMMGKIIRINQDGTFPNDNPISANGKAKSAMYSLGHRNPQGLVYDQSRGWLVSHEHGPAGGDEINIIEPGNNYGWPVITNGKDYSGARISPFTEYPGMEQPFLDWTPSIAPSDMIVYSGKLFTEFTNDYLVTTLKTRALLWVDMQDNTVANQVSLLTNLNERFRGIQQDPNGHIYLLTDSGKLLKLKPE